MTSKKSLVLVLIIEYFSIHTADCSILIIASDSIVHIAQRFEGVPTLEAINLEVLALNEMAVDYIQQG